MTVKEINVNINGFFNEVGELSLKRYLVKSGKDIVNMTISTIMDSSFKHDFKLPVGFDVSKPTLNIGNTIIVLEEDKLWSGKKFNDNKLLAANVLLELSFLSWINTLWETNLEVTTEFYYGEGGIAAKHKEDGLHIRHIDSSGEKVTKLRIPFNTRVDKVCELIVNEFKEFIYTYGTTGTVQITVPGDLGKTPVIVVKHNDMYKKLEY